MTAPALSFTGERFTPECVREIWYEHMHRYTFARAFVRGRRVLDAACGEGYGSALLAMQAASVLGVDLSHEAVAHARARYADVTGLRFDTGDCTDLSHLPDASFDVIASFETIEHLHAQEAMLDGFRRLLAPGGVLLVSTPDKKNYSDVAGFANEFHVRELYREEFESLLQPRFAHVRLYAQKLLFQSVLWSLDGVGRYNVAVLGPDGQVHEGVAYPPLYYIAVCANDAAALDHLPGLDLFGDAAESVYSHYNDEIRRHIAAGHRLAALEQELADERAARRALETRLAQR